MQFRDVLTRQEETIMLLVAKGWRNAKIAEALFISPRTVESHLHRTFMKLGVSTRTEAALCILQDNDFAELYESTDDTFADIQYAQRIG